MLLDVLWKSYLFIILYFLRNVHVKGLVTAVQDCSQLSLICVRQ